jgi:hypothetical protein
MAENLEPGLVIGRDMMRDGAYVPLIRRGTRLTPKIIDQVRKMGLERQVLRCVDWRLSRNGGVIRDDLDDVIEEAASAPIVRRPLGPPRRPAVSPPPRRSGDAPPFLEDREIELLHDAISGNLLPGLFRHLVHTLAQRMAVLADAPDFRLRGAHGLRHPANVTVLGIAMGRAAGFDDKQLCATAAAALLHEVGEEELELNDGLRRLCAMPHVRDTLLLFRAWQAGTGVLRQGDDDSLPHPAELLAVADLYDTMLADKPASTRMPPGVAFETVRQMAGRRLDARAVRTFCQTVRPYPAGTTVVLTDRRKALVLRSSAESPLRPVVAVGTEQIDLTQARGLQIADAFVVRREQRVEMGVPVRILIDDREVVWGMLVDVSDHGACLEVDGILESAFRVEIELGVNGSGTLRSRGVACWTRPTGERTTRIGLFAPAGGLRKAVLTHVSCAS